MSKRSFQLLLIACLAMGTLWAADNPFVGKWKLNPSRSKLTDKMKVQSAGENKYTFDLGGGAETIVADGTDQAGYSGTTLSVTVAGPDTWKVVRKKDGRMLITATWNLSKDGKTLADHFTLIKSDGSTATVNYVYKRTAGGSGFVDNWESVSEKVDSDSVFELEIQPYEGDGLSIIDPTRGGTANVKFDGRDYPTQGPYVAAGSVSSVRRVNEHALEMTDKINGKVFVIRKIELSADLKTLTMTVRPVNQTKPNIFVFDRE